MAGGGADGPASRLLPRPSTGDVGSKTGGAPAALDVPSEWVGTDAPSEWPLRQQSHASTASSLCSGALNQRARGEPQVGW